MNVCLLVCLMYSRNWSQMTESDTFSIVMGASIDALMSDHHANVTWRVDKYCAGL